MKVYISGRIKDYPQYLQHFNRGCAFVSDAGHEPVNPCEITQIENATYEDFMKADLKALLECDAIYMLKGWERSVGARCEHMVAAMCGLIITYESNQQQ